MKSLFSLAHKIVVGIACAVPLIALQANPVDAAGLLSPSDGSKPALAIQDHVVKVIVEGGYATTTIDQVFKNPHATDFEAIYSFPVPAKAAVAEFTYWIDGKPVTAEVLKKKQARQIYEQEKQAGREAALTEQDEYRTFDISVYPVKAHQSVRTRLRYIQPAHIDTNMGHYLYPLEEGGTDEQKMSFWTGNDKVEGHFSFDMTLKSQYPIAAIRLPAHPNASIQKTQEGYWNVHLDNGAASPVANSDEEGESTQPQVNAAPNIFRLDTDIIVNWRLQEGLPGTIDLATYKEPGQKRGTFMLTVNPGIDLKPITEGRDWVFVLDKSGSMKGKFQSLLESVRQGLHKLPGNDRFKVLAFDTSVIDVSGGFLPVSPPNIKQVIDRVAQIHPGQGTNLYAGLDAGLSGLDSDRTSGIILVTDGVANVGVTEKKKFFSLVRKKDVRLFTMIMGNSANRPLLVPLTEYSGGTAVNLSNSDDIVGAILSATSKLGYQALHNVSIKVKGIKTADIEPSFIPTLYRGQQVVLFGHYWGDGEAEVTFATEVSGKRKDYKAKFNFPKENQSSPELERLWAFATIEGLMREMEVFNEEGDRKQAIEDIALEYGLVTPYTSMLVVRDEVFKQLNIQRNNQQRVQDEQQAQKVRATQPMTSLSIQSNKQAFSSPRPTYSGGGAFGESDLAFLIFAGVALIVLRRTRSKEA